MFWPWRTSVAVRGIGQIDRRMAALPHNKAINADIGLVLFSAGTATTKINHFS
jgi:hypothetical protein